MLKDLVGLIVGGMSDMKDYIQEYGFVIDRFFGKIVEEIVYDMVKDYDYFVCFNFFVGYIKDNWVVVMGEMRILKVDENKVSLE